MTSNMIKRIPFLSISIILFLAFCFYVEYLIEAPNNYKLIASSFGVSRSVVMNGHFMRLATASLFHVNAGHLISNVIGLIFFVSILELTVGRYRTLLIVLLSGIGGELGSIILQIVPWTIGASSILFGVYGAVGVLLLFHRRVLKYFWVLVLLWIINLVFMNVIGYISLRIVDHGAHVGGFLAGVLTAASIMQRDSGTGLRSPNTTIKVVTVVLCVVFIIAFATEAFVFWP